MDFFPFILLFFLPTLTYFLYTYARSLWKKKKNNNNTNDCYIRQIYIHPIKSCAGIELSRVNYTRLGLEYDRNWMLLNVPIKASKDGDNAIESENKLATFQSMRQYPSMSLLRPKIDKTRSVMTVSAPDREPIEFPLFPSNEESYIEEVRIWKDTVNVRVYADDDINHWFSDYLKTPTRLATIINLDDHSRPLKQRYDPNPSSKRIHSPFSDAFPMLVASTASLADLNKRIKDRQILMQAFRPNIVLSGSNGSLEPWAEDLWTHLEIQSSSDEKKHTLQLVKPCDRCSMPNVILEFGIRDPLNEPAKTLHTFRALHPEDPNIVYFGVNAVQTQESGTFQVGDRVISRGKKKSIIDLPVSEQS